MKEIPILFNTPMVQAILDDRKKQTRRPVKCDFLPGAPRRFDAYKTENGVFGFETEDEVFRSPFGQPGDVLWVRETFAQCQGVIIDGKAPYMYKATYKPPTKGIGAGYIPHWKPSIHMPKEACRLKFKVKRVWLERVKEISEEDAIAEGIETHTDYWDQSSYSAKDYMNHDSCFLNDAVKSFASLFDYIYGAGSFEANKWVWCCEFEVIRKDRMTADNVNKESEVN